MRELKKPLRTAYYDKITALGLVCYETGSVPDDAVSPYVVIAAMSGSEDSNKTDTGQTMQTLLDVVTFYDRNDIAGSTLVDSMAGLILGEINSKKIMVIGEGLQVVNTRLLQDQSVNLTTTTQRTYRRLLRYEQLIMEV